LATDNLFLHRLYCSKILLHSKPYSVQDAINVTLNSTHTTEGS